jgi:hypothetical protein
MRELDARDPRRLSFEINPESASNTGVIDAYLHEHDDPVAPLMLASYIHRLGMRLVAERQTPSSQSAFVAEVDPVLGARVTSAWERLAILDASLELCANPVLWFARGPRESIAPPPAYAPIEAPRVVERLANCVAELDRLLEPHGYATEAWLDALALEVGPRVTAPPNERPLPGLALSDYDLRALRDGELILRSSVQNTST